VLKLQTFGHYVVEVSGYQFVSSFSCWQLKYRTLLLVGIQLGLVVATKLRRHWASEFRKYVYLMSTKSQAVVSE